MTEKASLGPRAIPKAHYPEDHPLPNISHSFDQAEMIDIFDILCGLKDLKYQTDQ